MLDTEQSEGQFKRKYCNKSKKAETLPSKKVLLIRQIFKGKY